MADTIEGLTQRGYRYRDIGILLRSVRTSSTPFVTVFRKRGIPFRCVGRTGLFLQHEPQLLGRTYAWLSDNSWKETRFGGEAAPVSEPDLARDYADLFGLSSADKTRLKRHLETWYEETHDENHRANLVGDYNLLLGLLQVHTWNLSDPVQEARMGSLARFSELLADFENVTRRARRVEENGRPLYRAGNNRGIWFYTRLFVYIQHYALEAYEAFEGEREFDLDAVDLATVHQAKGLEWSVVFVPCMVEGRFPPHAMGHEQNWLLPETVFPKETRKRYEGSETDERRLFYVAMTRSRDMLYVSSFEKIHNRRNPSRFLQDVASDALPKNRSLPLPPQFKPDRVVPEKRPTLAFSDLVAYQNCPLGYRLSSLMGFQPQLVDELGYGRAVHHILRQIAEHVRQTGRQPTSKQLATILDKDLYLPFAHQEAFDVLSSEALGLIQRYLEEYSEDLRRVWQTERPFELHLDIASLTGRADVILDYEGGQPGAMAIVDYKTAVDNTRDEMYSFQLAIYAAAGQAEEINVRAAYLHNLHDGTRIPVATDMQATVSARQKASELIHSIASGDFSAKPHKDKCRNCDTRFVCKHGSAR